MQVFGLKQLTDMIDWFYGASDMGKFMPPTCAGLSIWGTSECCYALKLCNIHVKPKATR